ncbi:MAG: LLM class flavin-dependent oxidoreductase [Proteobacteria bacterium]|jgi:luciferase family oxidoreductase group 1|nr:LLM class flavin-dependent oxidoreductase [Pseudomonadota bacterium]
MHHFSLLDLSPVPEGHTAQDALANSLDLARHAENLGFRRYWLAEHHNMPGIASAATSVVIGHIAAGTKTIRVGAGGIMLPNHSPLVIAEQFGTLATLYPDRIDLGLGRAPGSDMDTARALRRNMDNNDNFPDDVVELIQYLDDPTSQTRIRAVPGEGTKVPIWILGSSLYGAQFAAYMGLPYAFASHFAPAMLEQALVTYRTTFRPSKWLSEPYFMMGAGVCAADTDEEAEYLRSSQIQSFVRLRTGQPGKLPFPIENIRDHIPPAILSSVNESLSCSATGSKETVHKKLSELISSYKPDELIISGAIHSHDARLHSYSIVAEVLHTLTSKSAVG